MNLVENIVGLLPGLGRRRELRVHQAQTPLPEKLAKRPPTHALRDVLLAWVGAAGFTGWAIIAGNPIQNQIEHDVLMLSTDPILTPTATATVTPTPLSTPEARQSTATHMNLIGALFEQRGEKMFSPSLKEQVAQGGSRLMYIRKIEDGEKITLDAKQYLLMPVPSLNINRFEPYGIISMQEVEKIGLAAIAETETVGGWRQKFALLKDPYRTTEWPRTAQNLEVMTYSPAALDRENVILLPEPSWIMVNHGWWMPNSP